MVLTAASVSQEHRKLFRDLIRLVCKDVRLVTQTMETLKQEMSVYLKGSRDLADDVCFKTDIEMNMHSWEVLRIELWKICLEYTFNP